MKIPAESETDLIVYGFCVLLVGYECVNSSVNDGLIVTRIDPKDFRERFPDLEQQAVQSDRPLHQTPKSDSNKKE